MLGFCRGDRGRASHRRSKTGFDPRLSERNAAIVPARFVSPQVKADFIDPRLSCLALSWRGFVEQSLEGFDTNRFGHESIKPGLLRIGVIFGLAVSRQRDEQSAV